MTHDGRYLLFMASRTSPLESQPNTLDDMLELHGRPGNGNSDIWWVDTRVIHRLRPEQF